MSIRVERTGTGFHFTASNEMGRTVEMDASPAIGGENLGVRPMEMLLCALGGCSGIDVITILKKQKLDPSGFSIKIDGEREQGKEPSLWKNIHAEFSFAGNLEPNKVIRAVELSMEKYCSVAKTLEQTATLTFSIMLNDKKIK
jgi:putative redox protein